MNSASNRADDNYPVLGISAMDIKNCGIDALFTHYSAVIEKPVEHPLHDNFEYMRITELFFVVKK